MSREQRWYLGALVVLLVLIVAGYWGYRQLRWETERIDRGYSEAAQENPYLAGELFLSAQGRSLQSRRGFALIDQLGEADSLIGPDDSLILINSYRQLYGERLEKVWRWVEGGGQLLVSADNPFLPEEEVTGDPLLGRLGIRLVDEDDEHALASEVGDSRLDELRAVNPDHCRINGELTPYVIDGAEGSEQLYLQLSADKALRPSGPEPSHWLNNRQGIQLAQFPIGQGQISVFSRLDLWQNRALDCLDHGYLLWQLTGDSGNWLLFSQNRPGLWLLLWRYLPAAILLFAALLLAWIWQQGVCFAPLREQSEHQRPELIEHLLAHAELLWRHRRYAALLDPLQGEIKRLLRLRVAGFDQLEPGAQYAEIARLSQVPSARVARAMAPAERLQPAELVQRVQQLQRIKDSLCRR